MKLSITVTDDDVTKAQSSVQVGAPVYQADGVTPQAVDGGAAPTWLVELLGRQGSAVEAVDAGAPKL